MRAPRRSQLGLTLLEAVLALAVFSIGVTALFGMIKNVSNANRSMSFQNNSLDLFSRISAQIRDAQCDYDGNNPPYLPITDPGLAVTGPGNFIGIGGPVGGSAIAVVGNAQTNAAVFADYVPPMQVDYSVSNVTPPPAPPAPPAPPTFQVDVRIREITRDPAKDAAPTGPWVRVYPVQKVCAPRYDGMPRGAFF